LSALPAPRRPAPALRSGRRSPVHRGASSPTRRPAPAIRQRARAGRGTIARAHHERPRLPQAAARPLLRAPPAEGRPLHLPAAVRRCRHRRLDRRPHQLAAAPTPGRPGVPTPLGCPRHARTDGDRILPRRGQACKRLSDRACGRARGLIRKSRAPAWRSSARD
jgi:hypothetical protein